MFMWVCNGREQRRVSFSTRKYMSTTRNKGGIVQNKKTKWRFITSSPNTQLLSFGYNKHGAEYLVGASIYHTKDITLLQLSSWNAVMAATPPSSFVFLFSLPSLSLHSLFPFTSPLLQAYSWATSMSLPFCITLRLPCILPTLRLRF